jgi:hypothetical protein
MAHQTEKDMAHQIRVFVEVSDKYLWTLRPFAYLFNKFWSAEQPVVVYGFSKPDFILPDNFEFYSVSPDNYPAKKWSDALIEFLSIYKDERFVFLLCDYWLCRTVDLRGVHACNEYMGMAGNILRADLTDDRLYAGGMYDVDYWGCYDIIETPPGTPYQMSTQAGIWDRKLMLELLRRGKSAWEVEIHTAPLATMRVIGTRQSPIRYANGLLKGDVDYDQLMFLPQEHRDKVKAMIPEEYQE